MAAPSLLSLPPIKLTSRPVIGFDQTRTRHGKRGDVTSKASFQLSEFGLIGLFAVYGILRIAGIDPFARRLPSTGGAWGTNGSYGQGYAQGVTDALRNVPGAGTFGGIGQKAPGGGASIAIGMGRTPPPGQLPSGPSQGYRPPGGRGQA